MTIAPLIEELGLKKAFEKLDKASTQEVPAGLRALSDRLVKSIRAGTVTIEEIESFLKKAPQITPDQKEYLLSKQGSLLCERGRLEEGLRYYNQALETKETPSAWALKGTVLLQLERLDEAFQAFQQAYFLREYFGPQKRRYLTDLFSAWSAAALLRGLFGILQHDSQELQKGVAEYLGVLDKARAENLGDAATVYLKTEGPTSDKFQEVIEEWQLAVRLLAIKDPFEGWRELAKEISKVWPEGVSALDAIREQRE